MDIPFPLILALGGFLYLLVGGMVTGMLVDLPAKASAIPDLLFYALIWPVALPFAMAVGLVRILQMVVILWRR